MTPTVVSPAVHITGIHDTSEDTFSAQVTNGVSFSYVSRGSQWKTWGTRGAAEPGRIDMLGLNKSIGMLDLQVGSELVDQQLKVRELVEQSLKVSELEQQILKVRELVDQ